MLLLLCTANTDMLNNVNKKVCIAHGGAYYDNKNSRQNFRHTE